MPGTFHTEIAVSPSTERRLWVVVDEDFAIHTEARDFALALDGAGSSTNTIRTYIPKLAHYLNWCQEHGINWRTINLPSMSRYKSHLESRTTRSGEPLNGKTVNLYLTAAIEFLKFCALSGYVAEDMAVRFHEQRYLAFVPSGMKTAESGSSRWVRSRHVKAREASKDPSTLTDTGLVAVLKSCLTSRDRFQVTLLRDTGMRIGEALGLHRQDLHLLPSSAHLGCATTGPHIHVKRRVNSNDALAKSRTPHTVPASDAIIETYMDYMIERDDLVPSSSSEFVFINLYWALNRDTPMTYRNAKRIFERLQARADTTVRPHMLRHTAATNWIREGAGIDVVQELLGHASASSTHVYLHPSERDMRDAVEALAAKRKERGA